MAKSKQKNDPARAQLILDSDSDSGSDSNTDEFHSAAEAPEEGFKINAEYAKRFEHNKKREELQKCSPSETEPPPTTRRR